MDLQGITVMETEIGVENTEDCQLVCQAWRHLMNKQLKLFHIDISQFRQPRGANSSPIDWAPTTATSMMAKRGQAIW